MLKKTYSCDICHEPKPLTELLGCRFPNLKDWTFASPYETDGTHICIRCIGIIKAELPKLAGTK